MSNHFHEVDNIKSQLFSELLPVLTGFTFISAIIFIYAKMGFKTEAGESVLLSDQITTQSVN